MEKQQNKKEWVKVSISGEQEILQYVAYTHGNNWIFFYFMTDLNNLKPF